MDLKSRLKWDHDRQVAEDESFNVLGEPGK